MKAMISIGDKVKFTRGLVEMVVLEKRRMFASDIHAYVVKYPNGKTAEYDETQLIKKV